MSLSVPLLSFASLLFLKVKLEKKEKSIKAENQTFLISDIMENNDSNDINCLQSILNLPCLVTNKYVVIWESS